MQFKKRTKTLIILFSVALFFVCALSTITISAEDGRGYDGAADQRIASSNDDKNDSEGKTKDKKKIEDKKDEEAEEALGTQGESTQDEGSQGEDSQKTAKNANTAAAAPVEINDGEIPLAGGIWALANLILCILTMLGAVGELFIGSPDKYDFLDKQEYDSVTAGISSPVTLPASLLEEIDASRKKMAAAKCAGGLSAIASAITFFLTEEMSLPMALSDRYTPLMLIIFAVQVASATLNVKASKISVDTKDAVKEGIN